MATRKYAVDIDLQNHELQGAKIEILSSAPSTPPESRLYYDSTLKTLLFYDGTQWKDAGVPITNLSFSRTSNTVTVISSTGADTVLPAASSTQAGVATAAQITKLEGIETGATADQTAAEVPLSPSVNSQANVQDSLEDINTRLGSVETNNHVAVSLGADSTTQDALGLSGQELSINLATQTSDGALSQGDKTKLDGIETGADVTDATNVDAAGAVMNTDTSTAAMSFVIDEDDMASDSATKVPTQQSVKAYVDNATTGALVYQGGYDAAANSPDLDDGTPIAVEKGWTYTVTTAGTFFTTAVQPGDMIVAEVDNASVEADWTVVNKNIADIVDASESAKGIIEIATQTETNTGTDDTKAITPLKLSSFYAAQESASGHSVSIGDGTSTIYNVAHSLNTTDVLVQTFYTSSGEEVITEVLRTSTSNVRISVNTALTSNEIRVLIKKV